MKYILKNKVSPYSRDYIGDYLRYFGIEKVESFINFPPQNDEENPMNLSGMQRAIDMLKKHIELGSDIHVQVDSDAKCTLA